MKDQRFGTVALRRLAPLAFLLPCVLIGGCSQGSPNFQETYGGVDQPCTASNVVTHCTAHVFLVNHGGDGVGYATLAVSMGDATAPASSARTKPASTARITAVARCGVAIPNTPAGSTVDLTCNFDLPPGQTVASFPAVQTLDFVAAEPSSASSGDTTGVVTFALALIAAALAAITLGAPVLRRRAPVGSAGPSGPREEESGGEEDDSDW